MLVISSSVRMLNGIQRTTTDLRPATSFHLVLVKMGTSLQDWFVCCAFEHEVIDCAFVPVWKQLSSSRSNTCTCRASWNILRYCSCFENSDEVCVNGLLLC